MPDITINDQSDKISQPIYELRQKVSKKMVIDLGMNYLQQIGTDPICKVCISKGGSCCSGCRHLTNGMGCTLRNTGCTAWLCGFLKYVLYEIGHLQEWNDFWDQVPGQEHRMDSTPEHFFIQKSLRVQTKTDLTEALAADLKELTQTNITIGFIFELREKLDKYIDQYMSYKDEPAKRTRIKRNITHLSSHFPRFHKALNEYKQKS